MAVHLTKWMRRWTICRYYSFSFFFSKREKLLCSIDRSYIRTSPLAPDRERWTSPAAPCNAEEAGLAPPLSPSLFQGGELWESDQRASAREEREQLNLPPKKRAMELHPHTRKRNSSFSKNSGEWRTGKTSSVLLLSRFYSRRNIQGTKKGQNRWRSLSSPQRCQCRQNAKPLPCSPSIPFS